MMTVVDGQKVELS